MVVRFVGYTIISGMYPFQRLVVPVGSGPIVPVSAVRIEVAVTDRPLHTKAGDYKLCASVLTLFKNRNRITKLT